MKLIKFFRRICFLLAFIMIWNLVFANIDNGIDKQIINNEIQRETIFDRIINIEKDIILKIPYLLPLCDEIKDLKKDFVDIKNGKLYYEEEGKGIPLILLNPGPGGTHHNFHPYFSQIKAKARIIYYDPRGVGKSSIDNTGELYTIKQAVEDLENLRKELNVDRWVVLGWSDGGFLAQCYALTYPEHVYGLVLVAAEDGLKNILRKVGRMNTFLSEEEKKKISSIFEINSNGELSLDQFVFNINLNGSWKKQHYYKPSYDEMIRLAFYEWKPAFGFREFINLDFEKIALDGKFNDFELPTLIMEAKWDLTCDIIEKMKFLRKNHPHAQFEFFEKSGHKIFNDEQDKFFSILQKFLKESSKSQKITKKGNRIQWPEKLSNTTRKLILLSLQEDNEQYFESSLLEIYQEAIEQNTLDQDIWLGLSAYFINLKKHSEKCLIALQKYESLLQQSDPKYCCLYCIKAWQGHMFDLLNKREEAINCYKEASKLKNNRNDNFFDIEIIITEQWLQDRLKQPFNRWDQK